MHQGRDIRTAGDEVELTFRKVLRRKLPASYYVGHGHVVDRQLHESSQLDVVIANNAGSPILFQAENGSEYFPYESVYAIGEVKSSYEKSKQPIHKFADLLTNLGIRLDRERTQWNPVQHVFPSPLEHPYGNPLFSFMFFADAGNFGIEHITDLYQSKPAGELPNVICFLNKGVVVNVAVPAESDKEHRQQPIHPNQINLIPALNYEVEGKRNERVLMELGTDEMHLAASFGVLYYALVTHLRQCQLTVPNLVEYIGQLFDSPISTPIA